MSSKRKIDETETLLGDNDVEEMFMEELSSESESETENDLWDNDCRVITGLTTVKNLIGQHLMPTCVNDPELNTAKKTKLCPDMRSQLVDPVILNDLKHYWKNDKIYNSHDIEIIVEPFKICRIKNFIKNSHLLNDVREELYNVDFRLGNPDLYEFFQTINLECLKFSPKLNSIYEFLKEDVRKWLSNLTNHNLTDISTVASLYTNTDYLLLHDDKKEDRIIAFILYITDEQRWDEKDGGCLQLFTRNENGEATVPVRSLIPENNQLIFFPVTSYTFHQVSEIMSLEKYRLSINGWFLSKDFHDFTLQKFIPHRETLFSTKNIKKSKIVDIDLATWINDNYLEKESIREIQNHIENTSEISLNNFFKTESFQEVLNQLQNQDIQWKKIGPPNRFCYELIELSTAPHIILRLLDLFQSTVMFELLQKYTELDLTSDTASMKFELQRWMPGCYYLLNGDYCWSEHKELDVIIYFGCNNSSDVIGGRVQYVTLDNAVQDALITIEPEENNLNIVYRDSARFTKYFSRQSKCQCFYTLICSYSE